MNNLSYQDIVYQTTADTFSYVLKRGSQSIFTGTARKSPKRLYNEINISKIIQNYLRGEIPDFRDTYSYTVYYNSYGYGEFKLYEIVTVEDPDNYTTYTQEVLRETYKTLFDFDYGDTWDGGHKLLSQAINGHTDPREWTFFSVFNSANTMSTLDVGYVNFQLELEGSFDFNFSAQNRQYDVVCTNFQVLSAATNDSWITVYKLSNKINVFVQANTGTTERTGSFKLSWPGRDFQPAYKTYEVSQDRETFNATFSGESVYPYYATSGVVYYEADAEPEVVSMSNWITSAVIVPDTENPANGEMQLAFNANISSGSRQGSVVIRRAGFEYGQTVEMAISQRYPHFSINPSQTGQTVDYTQTAITINVNTNAQSVTVQSDGQWVSGSYSNGVITLNVSLNTSASVRVANISIYTDYSPSTAVASISVTQQGSEEMQNRFTTEALSSGFISLSKRIYPTAVAGPYGYRLNGGEWNYQSVGNGSAITIYVNTGDKVEWSYKAGEGGGGSAAGGVCFGNTTCNFKVYGNILSMAWGEDYLNPPSGMLPVQHNHQFNYLFDGCTTLQDAQGLVLPDSGLTEEIYYAMFRGCTSITTAPEIIADKLRTESCANMFQGCTNLSYIKCLVSNISATDALDLWVYGVSQTGTFVKKAGVAWPSGYSGIPNGWTVEEVS